MPIKVLLVEMRSGYVCLWTSYLSNKGIEILDTPRADEAERILTTQPDIAAVVVSAELEDTDSIDDTCIFVDRVRKTGFSGPMIGTSHSIGWQTELVKAGCNHKAKKNRVGPMLAKILRL